MFFFLSLPLVLLLPLRAAGEPGSSSKARPPSRMPRSASASFDSCCYLCSMCIYIYIYVYIYVFMYMYMYMCVHSIYICCTSRVFIFAAPPRPWGNRIIRSNTWFTMFGVFICCILGQFVLYIIININRIRRPDSGASDTDDAGTATALFCPPGALEAFPSNYHYYDDDYCYYQYYYYYYYYYYHYYYHYYYYYIYIYIEREIIHMYQYTCSVYICQEKQGAPSNAAWVDWQLADKIARLNRMTPHCLRYRRGKGFRSSTTRKNPFGKTMPRHKQHALAAQHQSYITKGIWRQGIGSFVRNSYVSTLCPVVICPYLCTSDSISHAADSRI